MFYARLFTSLFKKSNPGAESQWQRRHGLSFSGRVY
jgi:hypothetical protein